MGGGVRLALDPKAMLEPMLLALEGTEPVLQKKHFEEIQRIRKLSTLDVGPKLYGPGKVWKAGVLDWATMTWTPSTVLTTHSDLGGPPVNQ